MFRVSKEAGSFFLTLLVLTLSGSGIAMDYGPAVSVGVSSSSGILAADKKQTTYLRVGLKGTSGKGQRVRPAINAAIVLDQSGSMAGEKIERAKQAAKMFIEGTQPEDIVSVVLYNDNVEVLVPATKASEKQAILAKIDTITASGSTALFAGVSKGAAEVRKFLGEERINRVVLLSDGLANRGPSAPSDLAALGLSFIKEGISVTTLGLGNDYNEDLMTQLALKSDGNHAFIDNSAQMARIFENELGAMLKVVAKDVDIRIRCGEGVRPIRVLGRDADIEGQTIHLHLNQIYMDHERNVVVEVEVPAMTTGSSMELATAEVAYLDVSAEERATGRETAQVSFSDSRDAVKNSTNRDVMVSVLVLLSTEDNLLATQLRDAGKIEEARARFLSNAAKLRAENNYLQSKDVDQLLQLNSNAAQNLEPEKWKAQRKYNAEQGTTSNGDAYRLKQ